MNNQGEYTCSVCGATLTEVENGVLFCKYCQSRFVISREEDLKNKADSDELKMLYCPFCGGRDVEIVGDKMSCKLCRAVFAVGDE